MDNAVPKNVNWRINQCKETFCSSVFISLFSFPSECSSAVPAKGWLYKYLAEDLSYYCLYSWELRLADRKAERRNSYSKQRVASQGNLKT